MDRALPNFVQTNNSQASKLVLGKQQGWGLRCAVIGQARLVQTDQPGDLWQDETAMWDAALGVTSTIPLETVVVYTRRMKYNEMHRE